MPARLVLSPPMNKRKFVTIAAGTVLALGVSLPYIAHAQGGKKVFALIPKSVGVPFYNDVEKGGKDQAAKLGVECLYTGSSSADEAEQVQILRDLITKGVAGIAVAPVNGDAVVSVIAAARKKNIPVITFDSDSPKSQRQAYVGTDNTDAGREGGKAFKKVLAKGKIAIITGGLAAVNHGERVKGFREGIGDGFTEIPGSPFPCDDDATKCIQITQDILTRYPDLDGIFYSGGWALFGAPEAYLKAISKKEADMKAGKFAVVSFDSLPAELKLVKEGHCNALVGQRPVKMGSDSMDVLLSLSEGKKPENINTGVDVITKENVDQFLK